MENQKFQNLIRTAKEGKTKVHHSKKILSNLSPGQALKLSRQYNIPTESFQSVLPEIFSNRSSNRSDKHHFDKLKQLGFNEDDLTVLKPQTDKSKPAKRKKDNENFNKNSSRNNISSFHQKIKSSIIKNNLINTLEDLTNRKNSTQFEIDFCNHTLEYLRGEKTCAFTFPEMDYINVKERISLIDQYYNLMNQFASLQTPQEAYLFQTSFNNMKELQWDLPEIYAKGAYEVEKELEGVIFDGVQCLKGPGCVGVNCKYFTDSVFLHQNNLLEGYSNKNANYTFEVNINKNDAGKFKYSAIRAKSNSEFEIIEPVKVFETIVAFNQKFKNKDFAIVRIGKTVKKNKFKKLNTLMPNYPNFSHNYISNYYFPKQSEIPDIKCIKRGFCEHINNRINNDEKDSWQIIVDETGTCNDFLIEDNEFPSVVMAVIIPPGIQLRQTPYGYHSIERYYNDDTKKLREELLANQEVIILALRYTTGKPADGIDTSVIAKDFHSQLWKNILILSLELIAYRAESNKKTDVYSYFEEVGELKPTVTNYFDAFIEDIANKTFHRSGWNTLNIKSSVIVSKDTHPYLGYPDVLGHIFRNREIDQTPEIFEKILNRTNTYELGYEQENLDMLAGILTQFAEAPKDALIKIANTDYNKIEQYANLFLQSPIKEAIDNIKERELDDLCDVLSKNISQRPECYHSCSLILELFPEDLANKVTNLQLRFELNLNYLLSLNHKGDTENTQKVCNQLKSDLEHVTEPSKFRYLAISADMYNNDLFYDKALDVIEPYVTSAKKHATYMESGSHIIGFKAMTLALKGDSREALNVILESQRTLKQKPADNERWNIYKANIYIDLNEFENAAKSLIEAQNCFGYSIIETAIRSKYFRQALLKLQALNPVISDKEEISSLCNLHIDKWHPFISIVYWTIIVAKNSDIDHHSYTENLQKVLFDENNFSCKATKLIAFAYYKQSLSDGLIEQNPKFESKMEDLNGVYPPNNSAYPYLAPLKFNYK